MTNPIRPSSPVGRNAIKVRLGNWFEAQASGWGVVAIPIIVALLALATAVRLIVA